MVKKATAMHFVFVALLEDPKGSYPSTYNFRWEADICELFPFSSDEGRLQRFYDSAEYDSRLFGLMVHGPSIEYGAARTAVHYECGSLAIK
jgi:hypothetical protein